jgi:hypothetical protein
MIPFAPGLRVKDVSNSFTAALALFLLCECADAQTHDLVTNLRFRLAAGDLGEAIPGPFTGTRTLGIQSGGETLLQECLGNPSRWSKDSVLLRFGHTHPLSTIGCRERSNPSLHVVFYPRDDGSREARIHFDLYGPQKPLEHLTEVVKNRLTFGRTSQYDVHRNLVRERSQDNVPVPPRLYDYTYQATKYLNATLSPKSVTAAMMSASATATFNHSAEWGRGFDRYRNRFAANMVRQTVRNSIEFGAGAILQQEQGFVSSADNRFIRRIGSVFYHSFFVPGRGTNELSFPRVAAAVGTGWLVHEWHPWQQGSVNPWMETSRILSSYVIRSAVQEFKPELRRAAERAKKLVKLN